MSVPVLDRTESPKSIHWTMGGLIRLSGTGIKLHSTERRRPAGEVIIVPFTINVMSSALVYKDKGNKAVIV